MTDLRRIAASKEESATNAGKFLAKRGYVVMKQLREVGKLKCDLGTKLSFTTLVLAIAQGAKGDRTFGLKIEHETEEGHFESCLVDFDELKELLLAIKFLIGHAKQTSAERTDYTEYEYVTRDELKVGFFQDPAGRQEAFFDVRPGGAMMFLTFDQLRTIFDLVKKGREYLLEKGAGTEVEVTQAGV